MMKENKELYPKRMIIKSKLKEENAEYYIYLFLII